jgi:DNA-binding transcriptional LysR family regulator
MLDAHQLNIFLVASETLNFTQAAQLLHMSQPSVSQHIKSLEQHFEVNLFERTGRQLRLSDAGEALLPLAREMVNQSIRIEEEMVSLRGEVYGHLLVGCSTTPGKYVLPQLLARFHHQHPMVKVTCQVSPQANAIEMLCEGRIHFALSSHSHNQSCTDAEFHLFLRDPVMLIAPLEHPWSRRGEISAKELLEENFILREEESGTFATVKSALQKTGLSIYDLKTLLTLGNSEAIALAVQEGLGVGFVSNTVVNGMRQPNIAVITVRGLEISRDIYIGQYTGRPATVAQAAFWKMIKNLQPDAICGAGAGILAFDRQNIAISPKYTNFYVN